MTRITEEDKYIGGKVKEQRSLKGVSQIKLASVIGKTFQQVQKYENGVNRISSGTLYKIAEHLEIPVRKFFPGNGAIVDYSRQTQQFIRDYLALGSGDRKIAENLVKQLGNCARPITPPGGMGAYKGEG